MVTVGRARLMLVLVLGATLAACGGGGASSAAPDGSAAPEPTTAPAATEATASAAPVQTAAPGGAGTFTITVGEATGTGVLTECATNPDGSLTASNMADTSGDTIVVMVGQGTPIISGTVDGIDFALDPMSTDNAATIDGKSGTFSGSNAGSGEPISGSFACP